MYCKNCGAQINDNAVVCVNCGVATSTVNTNAKNKIAAALLAFFVGGLGIHNFYLGHKKKGDYPACALPCRFTYCCRTVYCRRMGIC